ncbi:MAG: hypothetical protein FWC60_04315 [Firmicutes bacterium]|nr:hypothetical protein [Bacillota bacterium]
MDEMILNSRMLLESLFRMIRTEKVKVSESNGVVSLIPILESNNGCPIRGIAADSNLTVDGFLAMKREEKGLESGQY